jgi:hypothetical protein
VAITEAQMQVDYKVALSIHYNFMAGIMTKSIKVMQTEGAKEHF